jgi:RHS repeat-associated protein
VRQLTNNAGEVTYAKSYDPYGTVTQASGASQSAYGFTGEQQDASGMVYLRSRFYNVADGRFQSRDPSRLEQNLYRYASANPVNFTDPTGLYTQRQIAQILGTSKYLDSLNNFKGNSTLSGRWGLLEVLHRANNGDHLEIYTFNLNGPCESTYPPNPYPTIELPSLVIGNIKHSLSHTEKGKLLFAAGQLFLLNDAGVAKRIWDDAFQGSYLILKNEFGAEKFSTFMGVQYPSYKIIWDEIDWPLLLKSLAGITAAGLIAIGSVVAGWEILVPIGLTLGAILILIEVVKFMTELIPILYEVSSGDEPSPGETEKISKAIQFLTQQGIEKSLETIVEAAYRVEDITIPFFDIRDAYVNVSQAVRYTP